MIWPFKKAKPVVPSQAELLDKARHRYAELKAKYDAAQTTIENQKHWQWSDGLAPWAAASTEVRHKLRMRSRYEIQENSSLGKGIVLKKAKDVIGRGPKLQLRLGKLEAYTEGQAKRHNQIIEQQFAAWSRDNRFGEQLRTSYYSYVVDGESFIVARSNSQNRTPVSLGLWLVEGDQCASPTLYSQTESETDGIEYDASGNPIAYEFLRHHPGTDRGFIGFSTDSFTVPAQFVIHLFREDRPGQERGIPHTAPALPLFAFRRRFMLATVAAAEIAADFAAVISSTTSAYTEPAEVDPFDVVDIDRGMMTSLPHGWQMQQFKAEHPTTTFQMFDECLINEVARCLQMPYNKAAGNSSGYTFASGKLDRDDYIEGVEVEQDQIGLTVCDQVFNWWVAEAAMIPGVLPEVVARQIRMGDLLPAMIPRHWSWDRKRETDPAKQATADKTYLEVGAITLEDLWERMGADKDEQYEKLERQVEVLDAIGFTPTGPEPAAAPTPDEEETNGEQVNGSRFSHGLN